MPATQVPSTLDLPAFERALRARVRGEVHFDNATRGIYSTDSSIYQIQPVAVVTPLDQEDVKTAVAVAAEHGVSILPRGGGTSLAGQTVGASLVLDFSKHLNKVLELNVEERWVRVQPGVVRDELNTLLFPHGLQFAPDPATANRANIGGMIGNNSSGTKSIVYGKTIDHILESKVLLADGEVLEFGPWTQEEVERRAAAPTREGEILRELRAVVEENRDRIFERYPKVMRRVQGYMLDEFVNSESWNLSKLIAGSEGSLGVLLETKLNLVPLPKNTATAVLHFADLLESIRTVEPILAHGPSAVEILDKTVLDLARKNLMIAPLCDFIEGDPAAVLIVEFYGETPEEAAATAQAMVADIQARGLGYSHPIFLDAASKGRVWDLRKNGLGLMLGLKGDRKPIPFIEDAAVPISVLPEYIDRILQFCAGLGTDVAMYAHASVGLIHVRPILDLRYREEIDKLESISEAAFQMVVEYGGSWCGEHGDGIVRSGFLERFFGPDLIAAFRRIKKAFDPQGLMNPGTILDPPPMKENLRLGTDYRLLPLKTQYHFREDGGFAPAVEMCTGVGQCRKSGSGTMCPSYMATREERHSTRGRANALRLAMTGQAGMEGLGSKDLFEVLDLCLSCKGCKSECPSNVDMARLKSEFLQHYHEAHGTCLRERLIASSPEMAERFSGYLAPLVNFLQGLYPTRKAVEWISGFDSRRHLPHYSSQPFTHWFQRRTPPSHKGATKVVLFADTYTNFFEPHVGKAAVELLESCGYEVMVSRPGCCQRPRISHGFLKEARQEVNKTLVGLDRFLRDGTPVVVLEPSCASALNDDWPDLVEDESLGKRLKEGVCMIDVFLAREMARGGIAGNLNPLLPRILLHGHCHQKALYGTRAMKQIWDRVEGLEYSEVDSGCCGMAGSFGYETEHYDLSMKVAADRLIPAIENRPAGTEVVACGFSCRHQIADSTGVRARHWVESIRGPLQS